MSITTSVTISTFTFAPTLNYNYFRMRILCRGTKIRIGWFSGRDKVHPITHSFFSSTIHSDAHSFTYWLKKKNALKNGFQDATVIFFPM